MVASNVERTLTVVLVLHPVLVVLKDTSLLLDQPPLKTVILVREIIASLLCSTWALCLFALFTFLRNITFY